MNPLKPMLAPILSFGKNIGHAKKRTPTISSGAGTEVRTRDLRFTRASLYQLSYAGETAGAWNAYDAPGSDHGGDRGIRTPDLLVANETRYQLRHIPVGSASRPQPGDIGHCTACTAHPRPGTNHVHGTFTKNGPRMTADDEGFEPPEGVALVRFQVGSLKPTQPIVHAWSMSTNDHAGAPGGSRTHIPKNSILSAARIPIPPRGQDASGHGYGPRWFTSVSCASRADSGGRTRDHCLEGSYDSRFTTSARAVRAGFEPAAPHGTPPFQDGCLGLSHT